MVRLNSGSVLSGVPLEESAEPGKGFNLSGLLGSWLTDSSPAA